MDKNWKKQNRKEVFRLLAMVSHLGYIMITPIIICIIGGAWLDTHFRLSPLFLIIGVIFGVAAAFRNLFDFVNKMGR